MACEQIFMVIFSFPVACPAVDTAASDIQFHESRRKRTNIVACCTPSLVGGELLVVMVFLAVGLRLGLCLLEIILAGPNIAPI